MLQLGKVQLLGEETTRLGVDICGLSEVRWDGQGHFTTLDGHTIVYSGRLTQGMTGMTCQQSSRGHAARNGRL